MKLSTLYFHIIALLCCHMMYGCGNKDAQQDIIAAADKYKALYSPFFKTGNDLMDEIVNDRGNGYEPAYGVRNLRVVLHGVMYRSGANNMYNKYSKHGKLSIANPLPMLGMENLCQEGFSGANYLYSTNYIPYDISCTNRWGERQTFKYRQVSVLDSTPGIYKVLDQAYAIIQGNVKGPLNNACWHGWHTSGMISAVVLMQFCGFTKEEATQYWIDGTNGYTDYPDIKNQINNFIRNPKLIISDKVQKAICPKNPYHTL